MKADGLANDKLSRTDGLYVFTLQDHLYTLIKLLKIFVTERSYHGPVSSIFVKPFAFPSKMK